MTRQEFNHQIAQYKHTVHSGSGIVTLDGGIKCVAPSVKFYGACQQDGTPTPEAPVPVKCNNAKWTTPVWNQLCPNNITTGIGYRRTSTTITILDNEVTNFNGASCRVGVTTKTGHKYYCRIISNDDHFVLINYYNVKKRRNEIFTETNGYGIMLGFTSGIENGTYPLRIVFVDLTEMFGAGNEPTTMEEFESWAKANGHDLPNDQSYDEGTPIGGTVDLSLLPDGGLYGIGDVHDEWDAVTGKGVRHCGKIDSYAGEEVGDNWISSTGELSDGATVIYALAEPVPFTATPQPVIEQNGYNQLLQESGDIANTDADATFVQHS